MKRPYSFWFISLPIERYNTVFPVGDTVVYVTDKQHIYTTAGNNLFRERVKELFCVLVRQLTACQALVGDILWIDKPVEDSATACELFANINDQPHGATS